MRPFTVAALAVADGPADAVGVVQLACDEAALALTLLRTGAYRPGFVPASFAHAVTVRVPYSAVRALVRRGRALVLTLDRSVPTPFHRLALARFTDDPAETLAPIHRAHRAASAAAWALPGPIGALAAALPSAEMLGGALGRASLALLVALVTGAAMRALAAWLAWGGPVSDRHREAFEAAMSERLGLVPSLPPVPLRSPAASPGAHETASAPRPAPAPPPLIQITPEPAPALPWPRVVGLAAIVALAAVTALVFVKRYGTTSAPPAPEVNELAPATRAEPQPEPPPPSPSEPPPPRADRCVCARADSSLWREGVPVLTVMTTTGPEGTLTPPAPKLDEHDLPVFDYDVAVVNNGAKAIRETRVVLTYAQRDAEDRRVAVTDRGLYWGLWLAPGAAVKWTTEGPGTEVRIDKSELGTLEERGIEPAPADAFFALTRARHRVVRLHAAMMLAYLRDARTAEALDAVGAPMAAEARMARLIRAAARPVIACDVRAAEGRLSACVFNASTKPAVGASLREIADGEGEARSWAIEAEVPVHEGVRAGWEEGGEAPLDVEVSGGT